MPRTLLVFALALPLLAQDPGADFLPLGGDTPAAPVTATTGEAEPVAKVIKEDKNFDGEVDFIRYYEDGKLVRVEGASGDSKKINEWVYYKDGKSDKAEKDTNGDGKANLFIFYEEDGVAIRNLMADNDGDGKLDEWMTYEKGKVVKSERDANGDGIRDRSSYYDETGKLTRTETDTDHNGEVDQWVTYKDGKPSEASKDNNGDGKPDQWFTY